MIRAARPDDATAIAAIWNRIIRDTEVTFTTDEKDPEALAAGISQGSPFFVAEEQGSVLGFVTAFQFRGGPGYVHTWEHSIHVTQCAQGRGLGRALMRSIEDELRARAVHSLIAGVSGANPDGVRFHAAVGYFEIATLPEVGRKFGRWYDLVLMQKFL